MTNISTLDFLNNIEVPQGQITALSINLIDPDPDQPRRTFHAVDGIVAPEEQEALEQLAGDIAQRKQLQPIIVTELENGRYRIVAGERRWRAIKLNHSRGLEDSETVQAIIFQGLSPEETCFIQLSENLQRRDLTDIEIGTSLKKILEEFPDLKQRRIAQLMIRSETYISRMLSFVDTRWAHVVGTGVIKHASILEHFKALPEDKQAELKQKAIDEKRALTSTDMKRAREERRNSGLVPPTMPHVGSAAEAMANLGIKIDDNLAQSVQNIIDDHSSKGEKYPYGVSGLKASKTIVDHGGEAFVPEDYYGLSVVGLGKRELKLTFSQLVTLHKKIEISDVPVSMMLSVEELRGAIKQLGGEVPENDQLLSMVLTQLLIS